MSDWEIRTCSDSLLNPGKCCVCNAHATVAVLTKDMTEHTRCQLHQTGIATKALKWDPMWEATDG